MRLLLISAFTLATLSAQDIVSPSRVLATTFDATTATWSKPNRTVTLDPTGVCANNLEVVISNGSGNLFSCWGGNWHTASGAGAGSNANQQLSNLTEPTSITANLLPVLPGGISLGSRQLPFSNLCFGPSALKNVCFDFSLINGNRAIILPDTDGTLGQLLTVTAIYPGPLIAYENNGNVTIDCPTCVTHVTPLTEANLLVGNGGGGSVRPMVTRGTYNTVLHGNASGDPTYNSVDLANDVTGSLNNPTITGTVTLSLLAGTGTRCTHVDASGVLSATGSDCGAGAGGGTVTHTGTLPVNAIIIGNGNADVIAGGRQGNTNTFASFSLIGGTPALNDCVKFDGSGNLTTSGASCGGGSGSVTNVAVTLPLAGGPISTTGTLTCPTCTTNATTATNHALMVGKTLQAVGALGSLGTTTTVLHGNAVADPTFSAVNLAADVTGLLPLANIAAASPALAATTCGSTTQSCVLTFNSSGILTVLTTAAIAGGPAGSGTVTASGGALTLDLPMFGAGGVDSKTGTKTGNSNKLVTYSGLAGAPVSGNCARYDASGNLADAGAPCGTSSAVGAVYSTDLKDFQPSVSGGTLTVQAGRVRFGTEICSAITFASTASVASGSGSGTGVLYVNDACALVMQVPSAAGLGWNLSGITVGAVAQPTIPAGSFYIGDVTITSGAVTSVLDKRSPIGAFSTSVGSGLVQDCTTGPCQFAVDPAYVPNLGGSNAWPAKQVFAGALRTPASATAACTAGEFAFDTGYHYDCVATNVWRRVAVAGGW